MNLMLKGGTPFLYNADTGDIVGWRDADGSERLFMAVTTSGTLPEDTLLAMESAGIPVMRPNDSTGYAGVTWSDPAGRVVGDYQVVGAGSSIAIETLGAAGTTLRVTTTTTSEIAVNVLHAVEPAIDAAGRVGVWAFIADYTKLAGITLKISYGDGSFTNGKFQTYNFSDTDKQYNGWHFVGLNASEMAGTWGAPDPATMAVSTVRLGVTGAAGTGAGNPTTIYLGKWVVGWKSIARLVLTSDDGYASWFKYGIPVLDALGVRCATSIIGGLIDSDPAWATTAQLQAAYANGHTFYVHGATAMTDLTDDSSRRADIALNRDWLKSRGFTRDVDTYVWPNGVYQTAAGDQSCIQILKDLGFKCARGTTSPRYLKHAVGVQEQRWVVPIIGADASVSVATLKSRIDAAVAQGDTAVIMWHAITLATATGIDYAQQAIYDVVKYAKELRAQGKLVISTRMLP